MTAIDLQGAYNVRDLGGLHVKGGARTRYGLVYRGDSLDGITPADTALLFGELSIGAIVDLRTKAETELSGLLFPVPRYRFSLLKEGRLGKEPFPSDDPAELAKVYLSNLDDGRGAVKGTLDTIAASLERRVATLFHCAAGRDRTGVIAAVLLSALGVTDAQIAADYIRSNKNAKKVTRKLSENPLYANHDRHRPEVILLHSQTILLFLGLVRDTFGGPRKFCLDSGVEPETLDAIARHFVVPGRHHRMD